MNVEPTSFIVGLVAEAIGIAVWFGVITKPPSMERIERETPTAVAEYTSPGAAYRIVVPIANPANIDQLMRTACTLAADRGGEVFVTSIETVPDQTPLSEGRELAEDRRRVLNQAIEFARERDIPASGAIRIGRNASDAILNTLTQHEADAVLLGWRGQAAQGRDVVFGSTVDRVVRDADCDVYVEKFGVPADGIESILLPTAGGPHAEMAAETANVIAAATGARLHIINVIAPDASSEERQRARTIVDDSARKLGDVPVETELVEGSDVVEAIVAASADHDLAIIGATREGLLQRLLFGAIPEAVGRRAGNTVIMTKRHLPVTSRLRDALRWR